VNFRISAIPETKAGGVAEILKFGTPKVPLVGGAAQVTRSAKIAKACKSCKSLQKLQKPL
jgi:hypothetical protein